MNFKLVKLTKKEIKALPFPETARLLGGILMPDPEPLDPEYVAKIRQQFKNAIREVHPYRTPVIK